jgi:hypothetical protein
MEVRKSHSSAPSRPGRFRWRGGSLVAAAMAPQWKGQCRLIAPPLNFVSRSWDPGHERHAATNLAHPISSIQRGPPLKHMQRHDRALVEADEAAFRPLPARVALHARARPEMAREAWRRCNRGGPATSVLIQTVRPPAADDFKAAARIFNALTSSERLLAAPSETRMAWGGSPEH